MPVDSLGEVGVGVEGVRAGGPPAGGCLFGHCDYRELYVCGVVGGSRLFAFGPLVRDVGRFQFRLQFVDTTPQTRWFPNRRSSRDAEFPIAN